MLRGTIAFMVLVAFALVGAELRAHFAAKGLRAPATEGLFFLVLGYVLGQDALGLFPDEILETLRPVVLLGIAWIGLVYGLQVDFKVIRRLRPWHRWTGLAIPSAVGMVFLILAVAWQLDFVVALTLAAIAVVSSPSSMEGLARLRGARDEDALQLLRVIIAFTGIPAVFVFHGALANWSPASAFRGGDLAPWLLVISQVGIGLVFGYALLFLLRGMTQSIHMLTLIVGSMSVTAGVTAVLGMSSLTSAAVTGAVIINRTVFPNRILKASHSMERPLLIALLVLVGASWTEGHFSWRAFALMAPIRLAILLGAGWLFQILARNRGTGLSVATLGLGLVPQGELALGILVASMGALSLAPGVLEAVLVAMVANHLVGQWWLRRVLFQAEGKQT